MKKTIRLFAVAAAMAVMAACSKEQALDEVPVIEKEDTPAETTYDPAKYLLGFGASMEETKADLAESGAFSWTTGDKVKVICLGKDKLGRMSFSIKDVPKEEN